MAKLNFKDKKEIMNKELELDLTGLIGGVVKYKISRELIDTYKKCLRENNKQLSDKIMEKYELKINSKDTNSIMNEFMKKFDMKKLQEIQANVQETYNVAEELYKAIPEVPSLEDFKNKAFEEFGELAEDIVAQFLADMFEEITIEINKLGVGKTPRG